MGVMLLAAWLAFNFGFFLFYLSSLKSRNKALMAWLLLFLLLGPFAIAKYRAQIKDGDDSPGVRTYLYAKNFILPYTLYFVGFPLALLSMAIVTDIMSGVSSTPMGQFIAESLMWYAIALAIVSPVLLGLPILICLLIVHRGRKYQA